MIRPLLRRLGAALAVLLGVMTLTFVVAYVVPGDPARAVAGPKADAATVARIRHELGLDRSLPVQYFGYLARLSRGDLGRSYVTREPVLQSILQRVPATAALTVASITLAALLGALLAVVVAAANRGAADLALLVGSILALSLPIFWIGILLLQTFAYGWRMLPLGGYGLANAILPVTALTIHLGASYTRVAHTSLREVLQQDFVRTAFAKGLPPWRVYLVHAARNGMLPLLTLIGIDFGSLMGGLVLTETIFNWPGLGRLAVDAVFNQDIPLLMGTVLFAATFVVGSNACIDALYVLADPRIRHDG